MQDMIESDVIVAGAGATGLVLGLALAQAGLRVAAAGPPDTGAPGRTVALLDGSVQMLRNLELWDQLAPLAQPLELMRLVDDTGSLFSIPSVDFSAREIGLDAFGYNIANADLTRVLAQAAAQTRGLEMVPQRIEAIAPGDDAVEARCADGTLLRARLIAGADGRHSKVREAAGIACRTWTYPQVALTAILAHSRPHKNASTEVHTREGPCTLVPLPPLPGAPQRSSLVWMMSPARAEAHAGQDDAAFAAAVERQSHFLLGTIRSVAGRGRFPIGGLAASRMAAARCALVGEAAHAFPPIGAQGLNLGLRDVAALAGLVAGAYAAGRDPGAGGVLAAFGAARSGDVATRTRGVDLLNRTLLRPELPADLLRGAGLATLAHLPPLRRAAMRAGLNPGRLPDLMRPAANFSV